MKKPHTSLLFLTFLLGILWIYRVIISSALFPCEGFGCIGSGILYSAVYIGIAVLGYIAILVYLYKTSKNLKKSSIYTVLSILVLFGIIVGDRIIEKKQMGDTLDNAYLECMNTFSGKSRESAYCETYISPLGN